MISINSMNSLDFIQEQLLSGQITLLRLQIVNTDTDINDFSNFDLNYYHSNKLICQNIKKGQTAEYEDKIITSCGLSIPYFNNIFFKSPKLCSYYNWNEATDCFSKKKLSYQLVIPDYAKQDATLLAKHHLSYDERMPVMVFDSSQSNLHSPQAYEQLTIKKVNNQQTFEDFRAITGPAFDMPDFVSERIITEDFVMEDDVTAFIGYLSGKPVSTSLLLISHGVAGIYWVATQADMRNKGLGEALTYHASLEGLKSAVRYCVLQSSKSGEPVYRKIGYQTVYHYNKYLCSNN